MLPLWQLMLLLALLYPVLLVSGEQSQQLQSVLLHLKQWKMVKWIQIAALIKQNAS